MPWLYNSVTGMVEHQNQAEVIANETLNFGGWEHMTVLPIPDNASLAQAVAFVESQQAHGKLQGKSPTTSNATANKNATNYVTKNIPVIGPVVGAATDINSFLSRLTSVNTWIRVGEFILGALLILSGTLKLTNHGGDIGDMAKVATKVIK